MNNSVLFVFPTSKVYHFIYQAGWTEETLIISIKNYTKSNLNHALICKHKQSKMGTHELLSTEEFARFRNGDKQVFRKIYDAYFSIVAYTLKRCQIVDDNTMDIIQETFLKLHQHRENIDHGSAIKSWLITTARNIAIDELRKQKSHSTTTKKHCNYVLAGNDLSESEPSLIHELEILLIGDLIDEITQQTGDDTFALFYKEGLSAQDIANRHNEALGTVTNRLSRLRSKFKNRLKRKIAELRESHIA